MENDELLLPDAVGRILNVQVHTLAEWRCTKRHSLPFVKFGRRVLYKRSDVNAFVERHTIRDERTA